ncbi:MAG: hypothetical protein QW728_02965 [Thermoplasmata archaeon]
MPTFLQKKSYFSKIKLLSLIIILFYLIKINIILICPILHSSETSLPYSYCISFFNTSSSSRNLDNISMEGRDIVDVEEGKISVLDIRVVNKGPEDVPLYLSVYTSIHSWPVKIQGGLSEFNISAGSSVVVKLEVEPTYGYKEGMNETLHFRVISAINTSIQKEYTCVLALKPAEKGKTEATRTQIALTVIILIVAVLISVYIIVSLKKSRTTKGNEVKKRIGFYRAADYSSQGIYSRNGAGTLSGEGSGQPDFYTRYEQIQYSRKNPDPQSFRQIFFASDRRDYSPYEMSYQGYGEGYKEGGYSAQQLPAQNYNSPVVTSGNSYNPQTTPYPSYSSSASTGQAPGAFPPSGNYGNVPSGTYPQPPPLQNGPVPRNPQYPPAPPQQ